MHRTANTATTGGGGGVGTKVSIGSPAFPSTHSSTRLDKLPKEGRAPVIPGMLSIALCQIFRLRPAGHAKQTHYPLWLVSKASTAGRKSSKQAHTATTESRKPLEYFAPGTRQAEEERVEGRETDRDRDRQRQTDRDSETVRGREGGRGRGQERRGEERRGEERGEGRAERRGEESRGQARPDLQVAATHKSFICVRLARDDGRVP
jgi:hypothetical protein